MQTDSLLGGLEDPSLWASELCLSLHRQQEENPALQCYLLADPARRNALDDPEFASVLSGMVVRPEPVRWSHPNLLITHRPWLLPLPLATGAGCELLNISIRMALEDAQAESLQSGLGQRICGWIFSHETPIALALRFGQLAVQVPPRDTPKLRGKRCLLGFFDPLILPILWALSNDGQRRLLFGPASQWYFVQDGNTLQTLTPPQILEPIKIENGWHSAQWLQLLNLNICNQVLLDHGRAGTGGRLLDFVPAMLELTNRLRQAGASDARELCSLVAIGLRHHFEFDRHPEVLRLINHRESDRSLAAALCSLDTAAWRRIANELNNCHQSSVAS